MFMSGDSSMQPARDSDAHGARDTNVKQINLILNNCDDFDIPASLSSLSRTLSRSFCSTYADII